MIIPHYPLEIISIKFIYILKKRVQCSACSAGPSDVALTFICQESRLLLLKCSVIRDTTLLIALAHLIATKNPHIQRNK